MKKNLPKYIEIELKFPLRNKGDLINFLEKNAKQTSASEYQKDSYFIPIHRDFLSFKYPYEWLRIRETVRASVKKASINYKHMHPENVKVTDYRDEYETTISDPEALGKIFRSLDIKEVVVVEKERSTWMYKDVEIAIDEVQKLGTFIELEAKRHFDDPKKGKEYLYAILKELNAKVGEEELRGYPYMMMRL